MNQTGATVGVSMGEASRLTGLPVETLRSYDRAGLLGELPRTGGNHRVFDELTLGLLDVIVRLRRTGMPIEEVRRFADLVRAEAGREPPPPPPGWPIAPPDLNARELTTGEPS